MDLRRLIRSILMESTTGKFDHLTLDDRQAMYDRFGVIMSRSYRDPQMALTRLKDGSEVLIVWDINSEHIKVLKDKQVVGAMLFDRDYRKGTVTPASGGKSQTIQVDPASRRNGVATAMMDYLAERIGPWDFSRIDAREPISQEAIDTFKAYCASRPGNVTNMEGSIARLEKAQAQLRN